MTNKIDFKIPDNKNECRFIGFDYADENSVFMFPCRYFDESELDDNERDKVRKYEAKKIITLIKRVRQEYSVGGNSGELFQFNSMIWLMQDFINRGYYVETEVVSRTSIYGKINWKKTIKQNSIFFNNGNIIYRDFVRDRKKIDDGQIITQIYKACLKYSVERLGFIFSVDQTENSVFNITNDKEFLIYYLKNELNNNFNDYKKVLLNHLLAIITNHSSNNKNAGFSIYDNEFEYVFEFLVNKIFGTERVKDFYNTYSYYLPDKTSASKLRPDTILKDEANKIYYIIDSKYYNFGYSNNPKDLPQSSSISKQIGYNHYLRDNLKKDYKVKSVFMLPYSSKVDDEKIKYVGFAKRDDNPKEDDEIAVCLIDLKSLIDSYLMGDKSVTRESLTQILSTLKR